MSTSDQSIGDADRGGLRMTEGAIADAEASLSNLLGPDLPGDNNLRRLNLAAFLGERYTAPLLTDWARMKAALERIANPDDWADTHAPIYFDDDGTVETDSAVIARDALGVGARSCP